MFTKRFPEIDFYLQCFPFLPKSLEKEKKLQFRETAGLLYVYGLRESLRDLLPWLKEKRTRCLVVLEDELGRIDSFLKQTWAEEFLQMPQFHLRFIPPEQELDHFLEELAQTFPFESVDVVGWPHVKQKLLRKTALWNAFLSETIHPHVCTKNVWSNVSRWPSSFYVNKWKDHFKGIPAILCGAGSSLEQGIEFLKESQDKALIMAGGSTVSSLGHFGLAPHLAIASDPNPQEFDSLKGRLSSKIPLLYTGRLLPEVFSLFDGPLGYIRSSTGGPMEAYFEEKCGLNDPIIGPDLGREALSVTTLSVALAHFFGCNPIILLGVDLAFTGSKQYAHERQPLDLAHLEKESRILNQLIYRKKVPTLIKWIMESDVISQFAKGHPETQFFDMSAGLGFKSIPRKIPHLKKRWPLDKLIQDVVPMSITESQIKSLSKKLKTSLTKSKTFTDQISQSVPESGEAIIAEYDLRDELAFQVLLRDVCPAYLKASWPVVPHDEPKLRIAMWEHLSRVISEIQF
jgi:hypothetical protein